METLVIAVVVLVGLFAAVSVWGWATETLESKTGKGIGDWIWSVLIALFFAGVGIGGLGLVGSGMSSESVPMTIAGLVVAGLCFAFAFFMLRDKG